MGMRGICIRESAQRTSGREGSVKKVGISSV